MQTASHPDKWYEFFDPENSFSAYVNLDSKEFCYKLPPNVKLQTDFQGHFLEIFDELTGKYYYLDTKAKISSWKKPSYGTILPAGLVKVRIYYLFANILNYPII